MTSAWILGRGGLLGSGLVRALQRNGLREYVPATKCHWSEDSIHDELREAAIAFTAHVSGEPWQIYWMAGCGTMGSSRESLEKESAMLHTLLIACEQAGLPMQRGRLTFASSAGAVYAGCSDDVISETSAPAPVNAYGAMKLAQEEMLTTFATHHPGLTLLICRLSNVYGAGQSRIKQQGLLTHIARCILLRKPIHIFVPFDTIRDYIHVDDAAAAIIQLSGSHALPSGVTTKIIASEEPVSIAQIIGTFRHVTRVSPRIMTSASPLGDLYRHRMKFRSQILPGHRSTTPLLIGIADVMNAERSAIIGG